MFASPPSAMPLVRSGRLRAIATTGTQARGLPAGAADGRRSPACPVTRTPYGRRCSRRRARRRAVITRLHREIADIAQQPEMRRAHGRRRDRSGRQHAAGSRSFMSGEIARYTEAHQGDRAQGRVALNPGLRIVSIASWRTVRARSG